MNRRVWLLTLGRLIFHDTNVVSELRKVRFGKADPNVAASSESVDAADLFMSAIKTWNWSLATALVHGMTVVTRNITDFKPTGVALINPWEVSH